MRLGEGIIAYKRTPPLSNTQELDSYKFVVKTPDNPPTQKVAYDDIMDAKEETSWIIKLTLASISRRLPHPTTMGINWFETILIYFQSHQPFRFPGKNLDCGQQFFHFDFSVISNSFQITWTIYIWGLSVSFNVKLTSNITSGLHTISKLLCWMKERYACV